MPSMLSPGSYQNKKTFAAVSCGASEKVGSQSFAFQDEGKDQAEIIDRRLKENGNQASNIAVQESITCQTQGNLYSFKHALGDGKMV